MPRPSPEHRTTTWGVVLAVALVAATLALNAPGGQTSLAGRAIAVTMVHLLPQRASAPAPRPEPRKGAPNSAAGLATATPSAPPPAGAVDGEGSEAGIVRAAIRSRGHLSHAPTGVQFRNVYAVTVLGVFNAVEPGKDFLGFCGELSIPEGRTGWGRLGWKPFFVSETVSNPRGQTPYLDMANPGTLAKCANAKPAKDYSDLFQTGATDTAPSRLGMPGA